MDQVTELSVSVKFWTKNAYLPLREESGILHKNTGYL